MAFRDYNHDGKVDLRDDMIEYDLFYEDDSDLDEHFRSLHNTLHSSYSSHSSTTSTSESRRQKIFEDYKFTPDWLIIILAGFGFSILPLILLAPAFGPFAFVMSFPTGIFFAYILTMLLAEYEDVQAKEKNGYDKYLMEKYPPSEAKKKIEEFRARQNNISTTWCIMGGFFAVGAVIFLGILSAM